MASITVKLLAGAIGLAFIAGASVPAQAGKARKHKRVAGIHAMAQAPSGYRGTNLVPAGPIYDAHTYLGDDPDPNIRFQIRRDVNAIYGGNN
jgi:hypothetical protein